MDTADLVFDALRYNIVRNERGVFYYNRDGERHREDGPAIERAYGSKEWYINGKRHREDGPAFELADGSKSWYINGEYLTEKEFNEWRANNS